MSSIYVYWRRGVAQESMTDFRKGLTICMLFTAMLRRAGYCYGKSSVRLCVRPSLRDVEVSDHILEAAVCHKWIKR